MAHTPGGLEVEGMFSVVASRAWPGSAVAVSPDGEWVAVALPGRVVVARLPDLSDEREILVADVRSLVAVDPTRLALAPHRGVLVIDDPAGSPHVGVRARGAGRVHLACSGDGALVAVGDRAALPRSTVVTRVDGGRTRGWTAGIVGATAAAWIDHGDLAVAAGLDLVLVRDGEEEARAEGPLGEPITAVVTVPGGVAIAGAGPRVVLHSTVPRAKRPAIEVPPGVGRSLQVGDGLMVTGTRSLGERVVVHDLTSGDQVAAIRGVATAAAVGGVVVGTGREGTVVLAR